MFALLLKMLPQIFSLIQLAEQIHGPGNGPTKLDTVTGMIGAVASNVPAIAAQADEVVTAATPLVNIAVAMLNSVGAFKKADVAGALTNASNTLKKVAATPAINFADAAAAANKASG